jgi:hypothetical protein
MFRKFLLIAVLAQWPMLPLQLLAGGPPWLCLPVEGVTADNAGVLTALIKTEMNAKIWPHGQDVVKIGQHENQHYLSFAMQQDVTLDEIEAALEGSEFSIPRDRLRLFGHAILELDAPKTQSKELVAALEDVEYVSINEADEKNGFLRITVEVPYPTNDGHPTRDGIGWGKEFTPQYSDHQPGEREKPATPQTLPDYDTIREVLAQHNASLKSVRWSMQHSCRTLGCVVAPKANAVAATIVELTSTKKN